ncbi:MAG: TSUP family transporter [Actinomycetota bacterium]
MGGTADFGWLEIGLIAVVFVVGFWNTAVGSTGGITFATMSAALSPRVAIPVQSVVEGVSGGLRVWQLRSFIDRAFLARFLAGGALGATVGLVALRLVTTSNRGDDLMRLFVAGFILGSTWLPGGSAHHSNRASVVGAVTTGLSLFIGGMGAAIGATLERRGDAHAVVLATTSTALVAQYVIRLAVFGVVGFDYVGYLPLILALTVASIAGTVIGSRVLVRLPPEKARTVFRWVVTAIAVTMVLGVML